MIKHCNIYTGGVDRLDQNVSYYRISIVSQKWWKPFFMFFPDAAILNGHIFCKTSNEFKNWPLDLLRFQREILWVYLIHYSTISLTRSIGALSWKLHDYLIYDGKYQYSKSNNIQRRCGKCRKKVKYICGKCDVGLHVDCFDDFRRK